MAPDLYLNLVDIKENVGLYAILVPEILKTELIRRGFDRAESIALVLNEARGIFTTTRTKPRLNELKNLASLISQYEGTEAKWTLNVLNDINDAIFGI